MMPESADIIYLICDDAYRSFVGQA